MKQNLFNKLWLRVGMIVAIMTTALSGTAWADEVTTTYTFTSKSWAATSGGSSANWTSGKDGAGFSNNGIQVTTSATGANGTSPVSFTNVTKIVVTFNTNKSKGAGSIVAQIGSNTATTNSVAYSGSADGTSANFTTEFNYSTPQTGNVKLTVNTTTNSIYLVSVAITTSTGGTPTPTNPTVSFGTHDNITLAMWDEDLNDLESGDPVAAGTEVFVTATPDFGYNVGTVSAVDADSNPVTLTANSGNWSFVMPSSNVTINATATANTNIVTLWSEDFSSFSANDVPSGGTYSYTCVNGGTTTKIYSEYLAGGSAPELLVSKVNAEGEGGSFTAVVPLENASGTLQLTYKANRALTVTTTTEGVTVGDQTNSDGTYTVSFSGVTTSMTSITIVFTNFSSSNARLDDIVLRGNGQLTVVNAPTFSLAEDSFIEPQNVELSCTTDGATIYYSFDNTNWTEYTTALNLTSTTTVYAKAILGDIVSEVISRTYTFTSVIDVATALTTADETVVYVSGIISRVTYFNSSYHSITYYISADGTEVNELEIYSGKGLNGANFTSIDDLKVGDVIVVKGTLATHDGTKELAQNSKIISLTRPEKPKHTVSFSVNGIVTSSAEVSEDASITFPANPADIGGKTFVGWTTAAIEGTTDTAPTFVTSDTMGTADVIYYAVFATQEGTGSTTTVTDVLTRETTGVESTNYTEWSDKTVNSAAVYAGQSAGGNESIQLRSSNNNSGIVTTTSGGKVKKVTVTWNSNTQNGRTLNVYGSNTAYTAVTGLYGDNAGTLVGTIVCGTSTELTINDDYTFVGLRSASGAMYLTSISIDWETGTGASYSGYCTTVTEAVETESVTVTDAGYATYCSENALDFTGTDITAYVGTIDGTHLTFTPITQVPANTGLLLKAEGGATVDVPVIASAPALTITNCLTGVNVATTLSEDDYILNVVNGKAGFYRATTQYTALAAHRAYISAEAGQGVKSFIFDDDDATAISSVESFTEEGAIYNVAGQRLQKMQKGINIVNGKKVLK